MSLEKNRGKPMRKFSIEKSLETVKAGSRVANGCEKIGKRHHPDKMMPFSWLFTQTMLAMFIAKRLPVFSWLLRDGLEIINEVDEGLLRINVQLFIYMGDMGLNGVLGNEQRFLNIFCIAAFGKKR